MSTSSRTYPGHFPPVPRSPLHDAVAASKPHPSESISQTHSNLCRPHHRVQPTRTHGLQDRTGISARAGGPDVAHCATSRFFYHPPWSPMPIRTTRSLSVYAFTLASIVCLVRPDSRREAPALPRASFHARRHHTQRAWEVAEAICGVYVDATSQCSRRASKRWRNTGRVFRPDGLA